MEKRAKAGPSRKRRGNPREEASFDTDRFRSAKHQERYQLIVRGKKINPERAFDLASGEFSIISSTLRELGWRSLNSMIKRANQSLVREFYANAYQEEQEDKTTISVVRGREVSYSPNSINSLLGVPTAPYCAMMSALASASEIDYEEILRELCRPGAQWAPYVPGPRSFPRRLCNMALKPIPKAWNAFFNQTVISCSNSTDVKIKVAVGLLAIMRGQRVNLGRAISESIADIVKCPRARLGHASVIHALCKQQGCPEYPDDLLIDAREPITAAWIMKQPDGPMEGAAPPQPSSPAHQQPAGPSYRQLYSSDPSFQYDLHMANWCGTSTLLQHQGVDTSYLASAQIHRAAQEYMAANRAAGSSSSAPAQQQPDPEDPLLSGDEFIEQHFSFP